MASFATSPACRPFYPLHWWAAFSHQCLTCWEWCQEPACTALYWISILQSYGQRRHRESGWTAWNKQPALSHSYAQAPNPSDIGALKNIIFSWSTDCPCLSTMNTGTLMRWAYLSAISSPVVAGKWGIPGREQILRHSPIVWNCCSVCLFGRQQVSWFCLFRRQMVVDNSLLGKQLVHAGCLFRRELIKWYCWWGWGSVIRTIFSHHTYPQKGGQWHRKPNKKGTSLPSTSSIQGIVRDDPTHRWTASP